MSARRKVALALAVLAVLGALLALWSRRGDAPPRGAPAVTIDRTTPTPRTAPTVEPAPVALAGPIALSPATAAAAPDAPAGELAGRVLDWGTGAPVAGAEVAIADGAGATSSFVTGADGAFVVRPPAPGRYRVISALADGYLPWAPDPDVSPLELVARPGVRVDGVALYLVPAVEYTGRVVDPDGAPVAAATVVMLDAASGEREGAPIADTFTTDARGEFAFHAPDGARFEARKDGFSPGRAALDDAVTVSRVLTIVLLPRGVPEPDLATLRGIVVDAAGAPIAGARVTVRDLVRDPGFAAAAAVTGPDGRFAIPGLAVWMHAIDVRADGHAAGRAGGTPGGDEVRIELAREARIAGRVVGPGGAPVPAATVAVLVRRGLVRDVVAVTTFFDAEGRFTVGGLDAGDYLVLAQAHGFAPSADTPATAAATPDEVVVTVRAGATLVGTVIDADTKAPLELAKVSVEGGLGEGSTAVPLVQAAVTRADGSFELTGIAPGRRSATAGAYAHHLALVGPFEVTEGARLGPVTIELTPTAPGETPRIELAGIGAVLAADGDDALRVHQVIDGGGAAAAGIVAGDHVLAVDGAPVRDLGLDGAIQRIRGPVGSRVVLRLRRPDGEVDVSVTRTKIRA